MDPKPGKKLIYRARGYYWDEARLRAISRRGRRRPPGVAVGQLVGQYWKKKVVPLQKRFGQVAGAWETLLPEELRRHSCLDSFQRGVLRVLVDSDAHYYELNLMVREGLADQIRQLCPAVSLRTIRLVRGRWYAVDAEGNETVSLYDPAGLTGEADRQP